LGREVELLTQAGMAHGLDQVVRAEGVQLFGGAAWDRAATRLGRGSASP